MKFVYKLIVCFILLSALNVAQSQDKAVTQTKETQSAMTPDAALQMLKDGNQRFVDAKPISRNLLEQVKATAQKQYPYAVILSCIDSRVPAEIVFDQGIGDFFSARIAGNIADVDVLGSMEFACKITGAKLIVVMGHSNCGAIKGAIDDAKLGNLTELLSKIKPAVDETKTDGERTSKNHEFVENVSKQNVLDVMKQIREKSPVLDEMIKNGEVKLVGGMYDLETGKVEFY